jgi:hypothetical protein
VRAAPFSAVALIASEEIHASYVGCEIVFGQGSGAVESLAARKNHESRATLVMSVV